MFQSITILISKVEYLSIVQIAKRRWIMMVGASMLKLRRLANGGIVNDVIRWLRIHLKLGDKGNV